MYFIEHDDLVALYVISKMLFLFTLFAFNAQHNQLLSLAIKMHFALVGCLLRLSFAPINFN